MTLAWFSLILFAVAKDWACWPWIIGLALVMLVKRPGFSIEFLLLAVSLSIVLFVDWKVEKQKSKLPIFAIILVTTFALFSYARWSATNVSSQLQLDERPIALLGDSLTDYGYPQELEKLLSVPVADFGVDGINTDDGIEMLPQIMASNPQLVVVELGGHDYNGDHKSRTATKANLETLVQSFHANNVHVVLIEIPRGFISDPYSGIEREITAKYDLQLIDDTLIRLLIFNSPFLPPGMWLDSSRRYSDDGLHPNENGNKFFAQRVKDTLVKLYGRAILKPNLTK